MKPRFHDKEGLPIVDKDMSPGEIKDLYFELKAHVRRAFLHIPKEQMTRFQRELFDFLKDHTVD